METNCNGINMSRTCGVYCIKNIVNNRLYVGSTKQNFRARLSNHVKFLKQGKHSNKIQNDFDLFGEDSFVFEILEVCDENISIDQEQIYLDKYKPFYNSYKKAANESLTNTGRKFSEEHVEKIRQRALEYKHSAETLTKLTELNKKGSAKYLVENLETKQKKYMTATECKFELGNGFFRKVNNPSGFKGFVITKIKKQAKTVKLYINDHWWKFDSYENCDRFLNKWRGFTSTKSIKNAKELCGYKVKFLE